MTKAEKRLRQAIDVVRAGNWRLRSRDAALNDVDDALEALLAEHRAEVETLRRNLADAQSDNAEDLKGARDAALEEALVVIHRTLEWAGPSPTGDAIRALKATPAQVVPVAKVREVLEALAQSRGLYEDPLSSVHIAMERLGVSLDEREGGE